MNQNWFKCAVHGSRYLLTVAVKSFGTDYLVMVLAPGIDNTGDTRVRGSQIRPALVTAEPPPPPVSPALHDWKPGCRCCSILGWGGLHYFE